MMDPAKLKVVELRAELQQRGLDTKGNKPVLVKRLKEALEAELQTELPDTSIADTSTEDISSQDEEVPSSQETVLKEPVKISEPPVEKELKPPQEEPALMKDELELCQQSKPAVIEMAPEPACAKPMETTIEDKEVAPIEEKEETAEPKEDLPVCKLPKEDEEKVQDEQLAQLEDQNQPQSEEQEKPQSEEQDKPQVEEQPKPVEEAEEEVSQKPEENVQKVEQNGENTNGETEEDVGEPKPKKSRWADDDSNANIVEQKEEVQSMDVDDQSKTDAKNEQQRDEKRRHSSPSTEQSQRRCSSPIREDEPAVDSNKVQLSWYDSDLHLQIDKSSFLSAKPLSEGLFGYIWAGARFTHGVKAEKACFEVKLTEELRFEDILSSSSRNRDHREKRDRKDRRDDRSRTKSENGSEKSTSLEKSENTEAGDATKEPESAAVEGQTNDQEPMETEPVSDSLDSDLTNDTKPEAAATTIATAEAEIEKPVEQTEEAKSEAVKIPSHLIRIGWSSNKSSLQLGEDKLSYALESSGKFIANSEVVTTEAAFKCGDVIGAYMNMETLQMSFAVNGTIVYTHTIELKDDEGDNLILFPHILSRNIAFEVNAGDSEQPLHTCPEGYDDFVFISKLEDKIKGKSCYETRGDCEVIMMCGLPAAGKTHWVKEHIQTVADKSYNIIGSSFVMDRMTVDCKPIAPVIPSERLTLFRDKMGKILNRLCDIGGQRRRDFILDQTNVFPTAIRRKMRSFLGFKRHAVVIVNEDEEQEKRMKQQDPEPGNDMSVGALLEMKANMGLPAVGESVEMVTYVSLPEDKAQEQVKKYVKQGRDGGFGNISHHRREYREDRNYNNRWYQRGSGGSGGGGGAGGPRRDYHHRNNYRDRQYPPNNRYDRNYRQGSGGGGGGSNWRPGGGSGGGSSGGGGGSWPARNDRRDRGPRDWRNNNRSGGGGMVDRSQHRGSGNRDHRSHSNSSGGNYNRSRNQGSSSGGRWGGQSGWSSQSGSNSWSGSQSQEWNAGWNQTQGSWNQNQWKYGGGYNQGGYSQYPQNWNNYFSGSNYQDWNSPTSGGQGQNTSSAQITSSSTNTTNSSNSSQYPQITSQQQQQQAAWAYAHYAQNNNTSNNSGSQK